MTATVPIRWIESTSWELPFHGLPARIPWPADVEEAAASREPFEMEHLLSAIEQLGTEAGEPWLSFLGAAEKFDDLGEALEDGELGRATELLSEIEQTRPGTAFIDYHRGYLARHDGREDEAIALYRSATEKTPQVAAVWDALGGLYTFRGQRDEAIAAFRRALQCKKDDPVALEGLAQLRVLIKLQAQDPKHPNAVAYVDEGTFRKMTAPQIEQLASKPDELLGMGEQLLRDGLLTDIGLRAIEKAREIRPDHGRTLLALGAAYRTTNRFDEAREVVTHFTELYPGESGGFLHLAQVANAAGDTAAEHAALDRALAIDPNLHAAVGLRFGLAPGEHDPSKEDALARFGEERKSWMAFLLASSLCRERGDTGGALRHAERAFGLNPETEEVLLHYTAILGDAREFAKLSSVIRPRIESGKYSRRLDWNYAQVLKQVGLTSDALAVLRKAAAAPGAPPDFKQMCATMIDAWTGAVSGCGHPLEVHPSGILLRPVLISLPDGDEGGVVLNPGTQLPSEARFPWRADGAEASVTLQQGQTTSGRAPHRLGSFRVRGIQQAAQGPTTIECHLSAQPDGSLHFRASQGGRKLQVGWTQYVAPGGK